MTPQELQAAGKIAALMRAARKKMRLTQVEVSKRLQISQSALSKIESGLLIPSAPQWFEFCEMTGISADSLMSGLIERNRPAVLESGNADLGFKVPKMYLENRGSKVRAMLPFLSYFEEVAGSKKVDEYFARIKMDRDIFTDLDTQISLQFCLDLSRTMIEQGMLKASDFSKLTQSVAQSGTHGSLHRIYDAETNPIQLLSLLLQNAKRYECNFNYQIQEQKSDRMVLSVAPEKHLAGLSYRSDSTLGDFLCQYKKHYFETFATYRGARGATLEEKQCHYHGADSCVYELKLAG